MVGIIRVIQKSFRGRARTTGYRFEGSAERVNGPETEPVDE